MHRNFLWISYNLPIAIVKFLCYNINTKEREEHSNVQIKYRTYYKHKTKSGEPKSVP